VIEQVAVRSDMDSKMAELWKKSYEHKDIYVFAVISIGADIHLYARISSWAMCGYSPLWDFPLSESNECLGEKAISLLKLNFLYNCDCFILMVLWFPIIVTVSSLISVQLRYFRIPKFVCYNGKTNGIDTKYKLEATVKMADDCVGPEVEKLVAGISDGGVLLLENVRFYKEEEKNDPEFAKKLASLADLYELILSHVTLPDNLDWCARAPIPVKGPFLDANHNIYDLGRFNNTHDR
ncbi:phosphoglycerate kinase, cytosolic-like protein, partial [Tanacetum coccineum]